MTMSDQTPQSELTSFFQTVATSLNHSRNAPGSEGGAGSASPDPAPREGSRPVQPWRVRPSLLAALAGIVLFYWGPFLLPASQVTIPETFVGTWRTSASSHEDRGFAITRTSLVLKAGPGGTVVWTYPITRVRIRVLGYPAPRIRRVEADTVLTLQCLVEEAPQEFSFRLSRRPTPVIWLVNQPAIRWVKDTHR
jgi:hypothetical protein